MATFKRFQPEMEPMVDLDEDEISDEVSENMMRT